MQISPKVNAASLRLGTESAFTVLARATALQSQGRDIINLGIGQPDFRTPDAIVEAACKALRDGHHGYTPAKGLLSVREAVAGDYEARHGVALDPARLMLMPGGKVTMAFACLMLGGANTEILLPDPGFPIYGSMAAYSGARVRTYGLDPTLGYGLRAAEVLAKIGPQTRLLILNSPGNPTGGVHDAAELAALAQGLEAHPQVTILSDEIYSRLYFDGLAHQSPMQFEALAQRTIILDGWSKTYAMTGWRLGWSYWPADLIDVAERMAINVHSCVNAPTQLAGQAALEGDQSAAAAMAQTFAARRDLVMTRLGKLAGVSAPKPAGAFYALMAFEDLKISAQELQDRLLEEAGVALIAGTSFGARCDRHLRLSFAASEAAIDEAFDRLTAWLNQAQVLEGL